MIMEQLVEWRLAGKTEVLGENLPQCHFDHHKSHMTWRWIEPGPPRCEASDGLSMSLNIILTSTPTWYFPSDIPTDYLYVLGVRWSLTTLSAVPLNRNTNEASVLVTTDFRTAMCIRKVGEELLYCYGAWVNEMRGGVDRCSYSDKADGHWMETVPLCASLTTAVTCGDPRKFRSEVR
jgi:hypothetical protein